MLIRETRLEKELEFQQECLAEEMTGHFLGPMNPQEFLDAFLPTTTAPCPRSQGAFNKLGDLLGIAEEFEEQEIYQPFIEAATDFVCGFEFVNTSGTPDEDCRLGGVGIKPDVSLYASDSNRKNVTDFAAMDIHGKFKADRAYDPFEDNGGEFERSSRDSWLTMGQMVSYAVAQFTMQFRTCIFSFGIFGDHARLVRWDRSGAVVTESFSFLDKPHILAEFFWRYSHADPAARGQDTTVEAISLTEKYNAVKVNLGLGDTQRLLRFKVYDDDDPTASPAEYIGPAPRFTDSSLTGRATRTFTAWDIQSKHLVLLKDTWREDLPGMEKEGITYRRLMEHKVPHIATLLRAGDIPSAGHETITHTLVGRFPPELRKPNTDLRSTIREMLRTRRRNRRAPPIPRVGNGEEIIRGRCHYRLVVRTIGNDLSSCSSPKGLVVAVRDAAAAHSHAWDDAQILHSDISADNIKVTAEGHGILINWDLAKSKSSLEMVQYQFRTTALQDTWYFVSAALLQDPRKPHEFVDDVESFFLTLMWILLRFFGSDLQPEKRHYLLNDVFDNGFIDSSIPYGGELKMLFLATNMIIGTEFESRSINVLMRRLSPAFAARYWRESRPEPSPEYSAEEFEESLQAWDESEKLRKRQRERLNATPWFQSVLETALPTL